MDNKNNLPIEVKNNLPAKIKKAGLKALKVTGLGLASLGLGAAFLGTFAIAPLLSIPTLAAFAYTGQKFLTNTLFKNYKDLAFVTKKHGENIKIYQDIIRPDIIKEVSKLNSREKLGFMQLQAIVGMSKFSSQKFKQENPTFETDTHSIVQKTFKNLEDLGYITNYSETFKKTSNLIGPKLAMGNFRNLAEKTDFYNVQFNVSDKKIDLEDENLRKAFPLVFSQKHGILNKYNLVQNYDGSLEIDYKPEKSFNEIKQVEKTDNNFKENLQKQSPSLEEQKEFVKDRNIEEKSQNQEIKEQER